MQLDLNVNFLELDSTEPKSNITMGQLLAKIFSRLQFDLDVLKVTPWAYTLYKNEPIEIDKVDLEKVFNFINSLKGLNQLSQQEKVTSNGIMEVYALLTPLYKSQLLEKLKKILSE